MGERDLVRLSGRFDAAKARRALEALPDTEVVSADADTLRLALPEASRRLPALFAAVAAAGGDVQETALTQPSLETLFIKLTGRNLGNRVMPFILVAALKDAKRRLADPAALLFWLGVPIVFGGLMTMATGGGGKPPKAHLLLVDEEQSLTGALLGVAARRAEVVDLLEIERVTAAEGRRRIDAGDASAMLVLPNVSTTRSLTINRPRSRS